jgi:hypothetical protein
MGAIATDARRVRYEVRSILAGYPSLYLGYARRAHPAGPGKVMGTDTQLMIEGFTRSANTFAVMAFQLAQPSPVRIARHLHAPAHVTAAASKGVPALLCIRAPEDTVLSTVIREPYLSIRQALRNYVRFYKEIAPYSDHVVAANFEDIVGDFGKVTRRINERFGTSFAEFDHSPANVELCFELSEHRSRRPEWRAALADFQSGIIGRSQLEDAMDPVESSRAAKPVPEANVSRPSEDRKVLKRRLRERYAEPGLGSLRDKASDAYLALAASAGG